MDRDILKKAYHLIESTRVMTLGVSEENIPWSSPVYFVFDDGRFYFFSNEASRHIKEASNRAPVAASIFHDSDDVGQIFGFQMSGVIRPVSEKSAYLRVVKRYVAKFDFLKKTFGPQVIENTRFFLEKFKSGLYAFQPETVFLSDNSNPSGKRSEFNINRLKAGEAAFTDHGGKD